MGRYIFIFFLLLIQVTNVLADADIPKLKDKSIVPQPINYQTVLIQPGEFDLHIPIATSFSIEYVKKIVRFENAYEIGKYEVSNAEWNLCYKEGGCKHPAILEDGETDQHPVARVNWHDAYDFSKWISKKNGETYRLPTEEEWTYAVRAGSPHVAEEINYDYSQLNKFVKRTEIRGTYPENEWGLADTEGNVWEWTISCWFASRDNILKDRSVAELNSPSACYTRIALGENRSHIPDFISDTYSGGCGTLRPAANLGFRLVKELK